LLVGLFLGGCRSATGDYTITYPAGLLSEHPKAYYGCYVRLIGRVTYERPQDLFPPYPGDPLLCDSSGCIYLHDDTQDLGKFLGKKVKVLGYVRVTTFNFPYVEVLKIIPLE